MDFLELEKIASAKNLDGASAPRHRLAILGSNSTQYLNKALKLTAVISDIALDVYEADYDSIEIEILNEESSFYQYKPDTTYIGYSALTLNTHFSSLPPAEQTTFSTSFCEKLKGLIEGTF
jgi:predicted enzyme involved in methoxymalonyl-ACP biosynthesis